MTDTLSMNVGNKIGTRRSVHVHAPPGGRSSFSFAHDEEPTERMPALPARTHGRSSPRSSPGENTSSMLSWNEEPRQTPSAADMQKFQAAKNSRMQLSPFATDATHDRSWANSSHRQRVDRGGYADQENRATPWATLDDVGKYVPEPTTKGRKAAPDSSYSSNDVRGLLAWEAPGSDLEQQQFSSRRSQNWVPPGGKSNVVLGGAEPDENPRMRNPPGGRSSLRLY